MFFNGVGKKEPRNVCVLSCLRSPHCCLKGCWLNERVGGGSGLGLGVVVGVVFIFM